MGGCSSCAPKGPSHDDASWIPNPAKNRLSTAEDEENRAYLERLFANVKPLCDFSENLLDELFYKSTVRAFKPNETVYRKGQEAQAFYIVMRGNVESDDFLINVGTGEMVGQMEVIENLHCLKTIRAGANGATLRQIKKSDFLSALEKKNSVLETNVFKVLLETPVFSGLSERELMVLKDQLYLRTYNEGEVIIRKGDGNCKEMYIIEEGAVVVSDFGAPESSVLDAAVFGMLKQNTTTKKTAKLEKRGYFGEEALLVDENDASDEARVQRTRGATVTAAPGGCTCLILSKDVFERNLLKIKHKFYRNIYARDHEFADLVKKGQKKSHEKEAHAWETHKSGRMPAGLRSSISDSEESSFSTPPRRAAANTHRIKRASSATALGLVHVDETSRDDEEEGRGKTWLTTVWCG